MTGIESEDISNDGERIIDPFDPAKIRVETRTMTIDLLLSRIDHSELDLTPGFQRKGGIWSESAQSKLIESTLIRIPLPAFYIDATNEDRWLVVDGLQRLTTLKRFVLDKTLRLRGLEFLIQLHSKNYDELSRPYQRRINETQVVVYLIDKGTPSEVKFNIFKRINTGGLPLSAQEIRHALNQGPATELLAELANSNEFKKAIDNGISDDRMADRECVLRFLAFIIFPYNLYKAKEFDSFLNDRMAEINKMSDKQREDLKSQFFHAMNAARAIFEKDAFRKRYQSKAARYPINKALFECWSVNLGKLDDKQVQCLKERSEILIAKFISTMNNDIAFASAISQGTGDISKVKRRFSTIEQLTREVLMIDE
jgi:uncharacterized protein with ParB-like and HNH nuclease domain